jgi:hypothetical protein
MGKKKHMKKSSPSLAIKEMQIKIKLRFHLTPVRIVIMMNTTNNKCWLGCEEKSKLLKLDLPYDPAVPLLGIYPKNFESAYNKGTCTPCLLQHYSQ